MSSKQFRFYRSPKYNQYDLWVDAIHLTNSGNAILARDFAERLNEFLCQNSNFQRSFIR